MKASKSWTTPADQPGGKSKTHVSLCFFARGRCKPSVSKSSYGKQIGQFNSSQPSRKDTKYDLSARQYARTVERWIQLTGLPGSAYPTVPVLIGYTILFSMLMNAYSVWLKKLTMVMVIIAGVWLPALCAEACEHSVDQKIVPQLSMETALDVSSEQDQQTNETSCEACCTQTAIRTSIQDHAITVLTSDQSVYKRRSGASPPVRLFRPPIA